MKLSNLSLAVLSAIALAACGSSGDDNQTTDPGAGAGSTPPKQITPPKDEKKDEKKDDQQDAAAKDKEIVNPTEDKVVDNIDLSDTSTTASQQYIRGEKSNYDNQANPSEPASTTVLSGITLDKQNPKLTNIVIARPQGTNKDGDIVQIAQFAGSYGNKFSSPDTLQGENEPNALVSKNWFDDTDSQNYGKFVRYAPTAGATNKWVDAAQSFALENVDSGFVSGPVGTFVNPLLNGLKSTVTDSGSNSATVNYVVLYNEFLKALEDYNKKFATYQANPSASNADSELKSAIGKLYALAGSDIKAARVTDISSGSTALPLNILLTLKDLKGYPKFLTDHKVGSVTVKIDNLVTDESAIDAASKVPDSKLTEVYIQLPNLDKLENFGYGKYIFTLDGQKFADNGNTANLLTKGWGDVVKGGKVVGVDTSDATEGGPTHGLVGIWKQDKKYLARGTDDNNIRDTRIFGHYYRNPGEDSNTHEELPEGANSWNGAGVIFTGVDAKGNINKYGLAASPIRLDNVQYGRVTAKIADVNFDKEAKTHGWDFRRQEIVERDPAHKDDSVDFYFYRGTNATSIKDMASLPTDAEVLYRGHALMYGIDNNFHGAGDVLPNAFGVAQSYGLGNFVEAHLDMGKQKLTGNIYNAWHSPESDKVYQDNLVNFEGKVVGNTAYGTAELAYDASADKGIFKGSFFGAKARELGGSVNSVTDKDVYGKGKWGGVFGAQRVGGGTGSAWLVSSQAK